MKRIYLFIAGLLTATSAALACSSMIVAASASADGRPMIWKHRDTSASDNFLHRVEEPGKISYVGLFNGGDTLRLDEAWMGMNDAGFAIINTVAYNLPENMPGCIDREGIVMAQALQRCRTVADFEHFLEALPKPMGLRTNFGVLDAEGNGAYFETDDYHFVRYDLAEAQQGVMIRTNYAYSGTEGDGMGYIRHQNVAEVLAPAISSGSLTPTAILRGAGCSFYHSLLGRDVLESNDEWGVDQDFVPRYSSTASIVIVGPALGGKPSDMKMYALLGYPPCAKMVEVGLTDIPADADATASDGTAHAPLALEAAELKKQVFPIDRGSGRHYIHLPVLRELAKDY